MLTIAARRPVIYVEDDRADRSAELHAILRGQQYRIYRHAPPLFSANNFAGDPENIFPNLASHNLLCVPTERDLVVLGLHEVPPP